MEILKPAKFEIVIRNKETKKSVSFSLTDGKTTIEDIKKDLLNYFKKNKK